MYFNLIHVVGLSSFFMREEPVSKYYIKNTVRQILILFYFFQKWPTDIQNSSQSELYVNFKKLELEPYTI